MSGLISERRFPHGRGVALFSDIPDLVRLASDLGDDGTGNVLAAIYDGRTRVTSTGDGRADTISDARGLRSAPVLSASGTARPLWDQTAGTLTGDSGSVLMTSPAAYDGSGAWTLFLVGAIPTPAASTIAAFTLDSVAGNDDMSIAGAASGATIQVVFWALSQGMLTTAATSATPRLVLAAKDATINAYAEVPALARQTRTVQQIAATDHGLSLFGRRGVPGSRATIYAAGVIRGVYTTAQRDVLQAWAVRRGAVLA